MDTDISYLQRLDDDLRSAARREITRENRRGTRRGRRGNWTVMAAAFVALLVVAAGIGYLAKGGSSESDSGAAGGGGTVSDHVDAGGGSKGGDDVKQVANGQYSVGTDTLPGIEPQEVPTPGDRTQASGGKPEATCTGCPTGDLSKVIRAGSITVVVPEDGFGGGFKAVTEIATSLGGFVLNSSIHQERVGTLTLRIPAKRFDAAIVRIRDLGRVADQAVTGKDVTADFIDLRARLGVLRTRRALIVELLGKATTVSGQLQLQKQFDDVQLQIEEIQGRLNVLNDRVSLATLEVSMREEGATPRSQNPQVRNPSLATAWDRAVQGFLGVLAAVVVGLGYLVPIGVLAGLVYVVTTGLRRRRGAS